MKIYRLLFLFLIYLLPARATAQSTMAVKLYQGNDVLPLIVYISGDGGFNSFTTTLCSQLQARGYTTLAINARSYFWKKKSPQEAANDIAPLLLKTFAKRPNQQLAMIGYSFGADVWPFILNRFPAALKKNLKSMVLLSPSASTDFEIHVSEMLGFNAKNGMDVVAEINKMVLPRLTIIQAKDNKEMDAQAVRLHNFTALVLPGNHHFDNDIPFLLSLITTSL